MRIKIIIEPWIKLKERLDHQDYNLISTLQEQCSRYDQAALKLELDYKLGASINNTENNADKTGIHKINEFMYYDGRQLIGYMGICGFGGSQSPLEVTGMVHPDYRRMGVFTKLHELFLAECRLRSSNRTLLLCDRKSVSGQGFLEKTGAVYKCSEFEMYLRDELFELHQEQPCGIALRKATNADAGEIARQNAVYFDDPDAQESILIPEVEEKRGIIIYLAEKDGQIIGKVHLQTGTEVSGIYGLGVLLEHRGKGCGRAILLSAVKKLKDEKSKEIMLQVAAENATALNLYKSCGFRETSVMDYFELK